MVTVMRIVPLAVILIVCAGSSPIPADQGRPQPAERTAAAGTIATYCAGCHNGVRRSPSGALLDQFDPARISENADAWTRAYRQLQAGTMPPVGAPRPDRAASNALLTSIEAALRATAPPANLTSAEIADRLARILWNSVPDASLLEDAQRNRLTDLPALERQISRMLNDDRSRAFVTGFFFPWLALDRLDQADPDKAFFPDYDRSLRDAMSRETELFLLSQLREDRDPIELWTANYTFLNERLARHYDVPGVTGAEFRRVASTPERAGLLGHGSVLMATSRHNHGADAAYTSPAARALWVRLRFLGASAPRAFPNAQPVKPELPITPQTRTLPAEPCANCHRNFFPLGYALENFDPIGRWRTRDQAGPVDASGAFVDGTPMDGVVSLRNVLLQRPDAFRTTVTEKLLDYAAGRPVNAPGATAGNADPRATGPARQGARSLVLNHRGHRLSEITARTVDSGGPMRDTVAQVYERSRPQLRAVAARYVGDEAEDVVQEACLRALRRGDGFRGDAAPLTWLSRIVVNVCLDRCRRRSRWTHARPRYERHHPTMVNATVEETLAIRKALRRLTAVQRQVFVMYDVLGHTHKEIAQRLAIPLNTSKSRLSDARQRLREVL